MTDPTVHVSGQAGGQAPYIPAYGPSNGRTYATSPPPAIRDTAKAGKYSIFAIWGFILSFVFSIAGVALCAIGLERIERDGGKGKKLAIAGIAIGIVKMTLMFILLIVVLLSNMYPGRLSDLLRPEYTYSQLDLRAGDSDLSLSDTGEPNKRSDAQVLDKPDDALSDTTDESLGDQGGTKTKPYDSVQSYIDSPEFQSIIIKETKALSGTVTALVYQAKQDTLIYEYVVSDAHAEKGESLTAAIREKGDVFQASANELSELCETTSGKASFRIVIRTQSGVSLFDHTWTSQ